MRNAPIFALTGNLLYTKGVIFCTKTIILVPQFERNSNRMTAHGLRNKTTG
jgi:hypothetical protein